MNVDKAIQSDLLTKMSHLYLNVLASLFPRNLKTKLNCHWNYNSIFQYLTHVILPFLCFLLAAADLTEVLALAAQRLCVTECL